MTRIGVTTVSNWSNDRINGKIEATIDPTLGIKFSKKVRNPQIMGKSTPRIQSVTAVMDPVPALIRILVSRYCLA